MINQKMTKMVADPRVPLFVTVLPHLLERRPVGLGGLDRLLQLLHQPRDLPQLHGRDSPGKGAGIDDGMHREGGHSPNISLKC